MPYSDPEKKRAYMAKYNPKYYGENREPLIRKNINRKKELRAKKRDFILSRFENACPHCGSMEVHPIKLYLEYRMEEPPTKPMMDLSLVSRALEIRSTVALQPPSVIIGQ